MCAHDHPYIPDKVRVPLRSFCVWGERGERGEGNLTYLLACPLRVMNRGCNYYLGPVRPGVSLHH